MTLTPDLWDEAWLPRAPYATDDFTYGIKRENRPTARTRRYVEGSPRALLSMLVVDVDETDALEKAFLRPSNHPEPSWVSLNPANGHGHVGWLLETPIVRTDSARLAPMRYAARVQAGLTAALSADIGYAGLMTKNPLHGSWETFWGPEKPYSLRTLGRELGELFPKTLPKALIDNSGLGRNCALFNTVRKWAYPSIANYWDERPSVWEEVVHAYAWNVDQEFTVPLDHGEVTHLARSIARWTWRNITKHQHHQNRREWGTTLSEKAAEKRTARLSSLRLAGQEGAL